MKGNVENNVEDNVEDNVKARLQMRDLDSKTRPWQHDKAWIRLPAQFILLITEYARERPTFFVHAFFVLALVAFGVWLAISSSRGHPSAAPIIVESITAVAWGVYTAAARKLRDI
ncbi:hypothetical protein F5Y01DRAFT_296378 [Xylaria sp. FL0043]|nr:hypothetical protein F5Y01DRAFT_296378 [Xylaria sp. FL0043]